MEQAYTLVPVFYLKKILQNHCSIPVKRTYFYLKFEMLVEKQLSNLRYSFKTEKLV